MCDDDGRKENALRDGGRAWSYTCSAAKVRWPPTFFFIFLGIANLYVAYHYSTEIWVNFKLFGLLAMTVIFIIIQALYMSYHMNKSQEISK